MKYDVIYFKDYVHSDGKQGLIADEVDAKNIEHAAYLFNVRHFKYWKSATFPIFQKKAAHFKFWGLTINDSEHGRLTLDANRAWTKNWRETMMRR